MSLLTRGQARWAALGVIVAALSAGGIAYASIPGSDGVIHGCYKTVGGSLRVIDTDSGGACNASETPLSWNQTGQRGPTGPQGVQGLPGPEATISVFKPAVGGDVPNDPAPIGTLHLAPGDYLVMAKLVAIPVGTDDFWNVECTLVAGSDTDYASEADDTNHIHFGQDGTMSMIVTHEFLDPGTADVVCSDHGDQSGPSDAVWNSLVITAIPAGEIDPQ
jgi:hypothetical protein